MKPDKACKHDYETRVGGERVYCHNCGALDPTSVPHIFISGGYGFYRVDVMSALGRAQMRWAKSFSRAVDASGYACLLHEQIGLPVVHARLQGK